MRSTAADLQHVGRALSQLPRHRCRFCGGSGEVQRMELPPASKVDGLAEWLDPVWRPAKCGWCEGTGYEPVRH